MSDTIRSRDLTVQKEHKNVLDSLTFQVVRGSITGLIGPSGSGKTTLMRALVGVQQITSGSIDIFGLPAGDKKLRRQIGYVTQSPAIYPDLTVVQNLRYFGELAGARAGQINDVITQVQLEPQRDQLVESLSGGQKTRASLAIALLGEPELLVLDEPTVGLDPLLRQELWQLFTKLAASGKTLIISSHVMDEANHCGSLLLLRDGHLLWHDTPTLLLEKTKTRTVEDAFIAMVNSEEER